MSLVHSPRITRSAGVRVVTAALCVCLHGLVSCSVDERALRSDMAATSLGGAEFGGSSAFTSAGDGAASGAGSGGSEASIAGSAGASGASGGMAGNAGQDGAASSFGGNGAGGHAGNSSAGNSNAGGSGSGSSNAGAPAIGPCGDVDQDRVDDCAENLAQNTRFDTDVSGWAGEVNSVATWEPSDAQAQAGSGSLRVSNVAPMAADSADVMVAAGQCIPVTADATYVVAARVSIANGQGLGAGGINLWLFDQDACKGTFLKAMAPASSEKLGAWTPIVGEVRMPAGARSMVLRLSVTKPFMQDKLDVLFDDVLVRAK